MKNNNEEINFNNYKGNNFEDKIHFYKKVLDEYEPEELVKKEDNIFKTKNEIAKICIELTMITDFLSSDKLMNVDKNTMIKVKLLIHEILKYTNSKHTKFKKDMTPEEIESIKENITIICLLLNLPFGFYTSLKNFCDKYELLKKNKIEGNNDSKER